MSATEVVRATALRLATAFLAVGVGLSLVSGCSGPTADALGDDGAHSGVLAVYISEDIDGRSETTYFLRDAAGQEQKLVFDTPPDVEPNAGLKVWGMQTEDGLRVTQVERLLPPSDGIRSALISGTSFSERTFAFVFVDIGDGINTTAATINGIMTTNADSIKNYYLGDSYQSQTISTAVFGPYSYQMAKCANSDTTALANTLRPMVNAGGRTFQHYLWYLGSHNASCAWSGLASVGTAQAPSRDTWYNATTNCVVLVQEPGHNFGMQHSSSLACPGAPFADDPSHCVDSEYGDRFDPMGGGCRHMNAWQKAYQGWFGGCNGVKITNTGSFNLVPFEQACNGAQFLQVKAPKARSYVRPAAGGGGSSVENLAFYYVELRTPTDFDGTLGNRSALMPMVLIHVADDLHDRTGHGVHTFLLDMNPATTGSNGFSDAGLTAGQTFNDPAGGLSITAQSVSATGATITVTYAAGNGAPTCLDGTTFAAPGPGIESCGTATTGAGTTGSAGGGGASMAPAGTAGTSGESTVTGEAGTSGMTNHDSSLLGGCACAAVPGAAAPGSAIALSLAFAGMVGGRRRRSRRSPRSGPSRPPR